MWKKPNRPNYDITQPLNDGVVQIYTVTDEAQPGYAPKPKLTPKIKLRYAERKLGIQRYYASLQNQVRISRVIRCQQADISTQDAAITEDGQQYRVDLVQAVQDVYPKCVDVTLTAVEQEYEVPHDAV